MKNDMKNDIKFATKRYVDSRANAGVFTSTLQILGVIVIAILIIDLIGFTAWIASGQHPVDGFYIGSITANVLKAILF